MQNAAFIRSSWKDFTLNSLKLSTQVHCQILGKGNRRGKLREKIKRIKIDINIKMLETLERM